MATGSPFLNMLQDNIAATAQASAEEERQKRLQDYVLRKKAEQEAQAAQGRSMAFQPTAEMLQATQTPKVRNLAAYVQGVEGERRQQNFTPVDANFQPVAPGPDSMLPDTDPVVQQAQLEQRKGLEDFIGAQPAATQTGYYSGVADFAKAKMAPKSAPLDPQAAAKDAAARLDKAQSELNTQTDMMDKALQFAETGAELADRIRNNNVTSADEFNAAAQLTAANQAGALRESDLANISGYGADPVIQMMMAAATEGNLGRLLTLLSGGDPQKIKEYAQSRGITLPDKERLFTDKAGLAVARLLKQIGQREYNNSKRRLELYNTQVYKPYANFYQELPLQNKMMVSPDFIDQTLQFREQKAREIFEERANRARQGAGPDDNVVIDDPEAEEIVRKHTGGQ